jgi:Carboxypeptidase regulatory-like domain
LEVANRTLGRNLWCIGFLIIPTLVLAQATKISGGITDQQGYSISRTPVTLTNSTDKHVEETLTNEEGRFVFSNVPPGTYVVAVRATGFEPVERALVANAKSPVTINIELKVAVQSEVVAVTADVTEGNVLAPDPAQRVMVHEEILDANPGRPGAPVSIPGVPVETASGGIKAPQYFAPGVAGDHGEPIAQYVQVGSYLFPNNLSANAHGNGYSDPNVLIPSAIESVQTDGGAFNVREGNHSQNLAATYGLRSQVDPFLAITADYRDIDVVGGWSPTPTSWITAQASYGNGFLDRLEHRQQYKLNALRSFTFGNHLLSLLGIGYYGSSYVPGLVPLRTPNLHDTIDARQKDQTHTGLVVANDAWHLTTQQELLLSGFFRTYNLALFSDFGDGLIRQSEFRTVTGGNATYRNNVAEFVTLLGGVDYQRDAPRRLDLDHYMSTNPRVYGPFERITGNNVTINDIAPYVALDGSLSKYVHYYMGFRHDQIDFGNQDLLAPGHSFDRWTGVNLPKATISFSPGEHSFLPFLALSGGEAFFTNDPRIGTGTTTNATLVSRSHSYQLVTSKTVKGTEFRLSLGHVTTEASLAKIDPDTGLQRDEGAGRLRFVTASARRYFRRVMLQASWSQADARDVDTGQPTPEAPRMIFDVLGTVNRLPWGLQARSEFEYVRAKPLGDGFIGVPVKEFRLAIVRSFEGGRLSAGMNLLVARGYTGQTTEVLALPDEAAPFERVVGVRLPSYVGFSFSYRFGTRRTP